MATLKDIAEKANVDVSIVSRILHKHEYGRASKVTRLRIEQAAKELNYEPNGLARSLVRRRTDMVGLLVPDLYEPAFVRYLEIIDELMGRQGIQVIPMLTRWSMEREEKWLGMARQRQVDGVVSFFYEGITDVSSYLELQKRGVPVVFRTSDSHVVISKFDRVELDIAEGAYALTRHMLESGYSNVAMLGGFGTLEIMEGKEPVSMLTKSYLRACEEKGKPRNPQLAIPCRDDGADAMDRLLERLHECPGAFDAILVQSNSKLPGVYRALNQCGLRIGKDIGIATITDSEYCHLGEVPITVWEQPVQEVSEALVRLLLNRLNSTEEERQRVSLSSRLIVRGSTQRG